MRFTTKVIEWKLYGPLLEIEWILIIHNNVDIVSKLWIHSIEIGWIYYRLSGAILNFIVWISHFFPVIPCILTPEYFIFTTVVIFLS